MTKGSVFMTHKTQAVRLPADVRFPEGVKQVLVEVVGNTRVLIPVESVWESYFDDPSPVSEDFMRERDDDLPQESRESFD